MHATGFNVLPGLQQHRTYEDLVGDQWPSEWLRMLQEKHGQAAG